MGSEAEGTEAEREAVRARAVEGVPSWYRAWAHWAATTGIGLACAVPALFLVRDFKLWYLAFAALCFVVSNATEWWAHKFLLHHRIPGFTVLYDRHTPVHHRIFVTWDMEVRDPREYRLVFIPSFGILTVFLGTIPIAALLILAGAWDLSMVFIAQGMLYVVAYEWLHGCYHAPASSWLGRRRLVQVLRRHHAIHHDPALMRRWNFNVSVPLWDWVRGTIAPASAARWEAGARADRARADHA